MVNNSEFPQPVQLHGNVTTEIIVLLDATEQFAGEVICTSTSEWEAGSGASVKLKRTFECQVDVPKVVRRDVSKE